MPEMKSLSGANTSQFPFHKLPDEIATMVIRNLSLKDRYENVSRTSRRFRNLAQETVPDLIPPGTGGAMSEVRSKEYHSKDAWNHQAAHAALEHALVENYLPFGGHEKPVSHVNFTDDDHVVMILDSENTTRQYVLTPPFKEQPVNLRRSPVSCSVSFKDGNIEIGRVNYIYAIAGGTKLLVGTVLGIFIFSHDDFTSAIGAFRHPDGAISESAHASGDGRTILAVYSEEVAVWQWDEWDSPIHRLPAAQVRVAPAGRRVFSNSIIAHDASFAVVSNDDGGCFLWRLNQPNAPLKPMAKDDCAALCVSPDGRLLATGHDSGRVYLGETKIVKGELRSSKCACFDCVPDEVSVSCLAFSPDGQTLAIGFADGRICLWLHQQESAAHRKWLTVGEEENWISTLKWAKNGKRLLSVGSCAPYARLWATDVTEKMRATAR